MDELKSDANSLDELASGGKSMDELASLSQFSPQLSGGGLDGSVTTEPCALRGLRNPPVQAGREGRVVPFCTLKVQLQLS
jgi:hypothetical protein